MSLARVSLTLTLILNLTFIYSFIYSIDIEATMMSKRDVKKTLGALIGGGTSANTDGSEDFRGWPLVGEESIIFSLYEFLYVKKNFLTCRRWERH